MTSLSEQLQRLAIPAAAQLTADRRRASFLFDAKQAAGLDRETVFKIGQQGLSALKEIDAAFGEFDSNLFAESSQNVDRSILSKDANAKLNANIEKFLLRITPYFLLSPAHKAIEWLVYRFNVHEFNVDAVLAAGLPYHDTNTFARLLSIVELAPNDRQWAWLQSFKKSEAPVTRRALINACQSSNHALVSFVCEQIPRAIATLGEDELATKAQVLFTFVTSTLIGVLEDGSLVTDKLISKIVPYLAIALRSKLKPYRLCSLMVTCQLGVVVTLSDTVVQSLLKLILLKGNVATIEASLAACVVLCQRQTVSRLPRKAILKLARKAADLSLITHLTSLSETFDLDRFLKALWTTLLDQSIIVDDDARQVCADLIASTITELKLTPDEAATFFRLFMEAQGGSPKVDFPSNLKTAVRAACLRHAASFDVVRKEWIVQDAGVVEAVITRCSIAPHEIGITSAETETNAERKKRRRRNSSMRQSES
uniref:HEAT repeat-containing protein 1 n=1 Tax=Plectus sambesii TaxID=2011161 RepID=A0A914X4D5_9BILA